MIIHLRRHKPAFMPICWLNGAPPEEDIHKAFMTVPEITKVNCPECLDMYYSIGKELGLSRASFDLWMDGNELEESAGWHQPVNLDFERFRNDDHYAALVSDHISQVLENLAREVEEIGTQNPPLPELDDVEACQI